MLNNRLRMFIFIDSESSRVLAVKKSRGADFSIISKHWKCFELMSTELPTIKETLLNTWDILKGLQIIKEPTGEELVRLTLLQKKIEVLLSIKASLHVIENQLRPQFSARRIIQAPVSRVNFYEFWKLMRQEKKTLMNKMSSFFIETQSKIELSPSSEEVQSIYQDLNYNLTLGGYAALSKDIEEEHVKRDKYR